MPFFRHTYNVFPGCDTERVPHLYRTNGLPVPNTLRAASRLRIAGKASHGLSHTYVMPRHMRMSCLVTYVCHASSHAYVMPRHIRMSCFVTYVCHVSSHTYVMFRHIRMSCHVTYARLDPSICMYSISTFYEEDFFLPSSSVGLRLPTFAT